MRARQLLRAVYGPLELPGRATLLAWLNPEPDGPSNTAAPFVPPILSFMPNETQPSRTSTPKSELERVAWPRLEPDLVSLLRRHGESRPLAPGDILFDVGQESYDFIYIEAGSVEILDRADDRVVVRIDAGNFIGELGMLMGQKTFLAGVVAEHAKSS